ncbi:MAG: FmdB family zinc ribbon protein [Anaeromyxobacteraceae bacterium]
MPIYEYQCPKCGKFDVIQKMSDAPLETHEPCGSPVSKLMSASSFSFKGSGFYITDYGGKSPAHVTPGERAESKPAEPSCSTPAAGGACASCPSNPVNS